MITAAIVLAAYFAAMCTICVAETGSPSIGPQTRTNDQVETRDRGAHPEDGRLESVLLPVPCEPDTAILEPARSST
jgi:hypothetical protein